MAHVIVLLYYFHHFAGWRPSSYYIHWLTHQDEVTLGIVRSGNGEPFSGGAYFGMLVLGNTIIRQTVNIKAR